MVEQQVGAARSNPGKIPVFHSDPNGTLLWVDHFGFCLKTLTAFLNISVQFCFIIILQGVTVEELQNRYLKIMAS